MVRKVLMPVEQRSMPGFAENLKAHRQRLGLTHSDLAREIWGVMKDNRGYDVARNRDRISVWESGKAVPSRDNLEKLAEVLGVPVEQLAPDVVIQQMERTPAPISFAMIPGSDGIVHLVVNMLVSLETAVAVSKLVADDAKARVV